MIKTHEEPLFSVIEELIGAPSWALLEHRLSIPEGLRSTPLADGHLSRAEVAMALAVGLLSDLCVRVPLASAYVREGGPDGRRFVFDHGAMRTVAFASGGLPAGRAAIARILEPLGYEQTRAYPLERLGMTGYVYTHQDFPEVLPQYFVSELEPEHFSAEFQSAVSGLLSTSVDPLADRAKAALAELSTTGSLDGERVTRLLARLMTCFGRHHREPTLDEYELFLSESAEMAWIATEGHSFNHITDRVENVEQVAAHQRALGRPVKDELEVSGSGRVIQTAFAATMVERIFGVKKGYLTRTVRGSFLEFISRERLEDGSLDLAFDAQNAQGIFKMTDARSAS